MKDFFKGMIGVIIALSLYGCAGMSDYDISLPGGYSLVRSSAHKVTINKRIDKSSWEESIIPAKVIGLGWNSDYVLAKQVGLKRRNPENSEDTYEIPDENKISYWILEVNDDKVYGPLDEKEFEELKKEFNISYMVTLKNPSEYNEK